MANYTHTLWKVGLVQFDSGNPLLPFYATRGMLFHQITANSASRLTAVRTMYSINFTACVTLDSAGKALYGPGWWQDVNPCYAIDVVAPASPPFPSPWGGFAPTTESVASGGFDFNLEPGSVDPSTGHGTQVAIWNASGSSEGARSFAPGAGAMVVGNIGINYNSFTAGYSGTYDPITWNVSGYVKTLFGSNSTIT